MTDRPSAPLSDLLRRVTRDIDLDLAVTIADVINLYHAALVRNAGRSILGPQDAIRILHIINSIQEACAGEGDPELIPGAPARRSERQEAQAG